MREYMTIPEMAKYLRVSKKTLYRWRSHEGMPYYCIGGAIRYEVKAVKEWMAQHHRNGKCQIMPRLRRVG